MDLKSTMASVKCLMTSAAAYTQLFVERGNSLPAAVLAGFRATLWSVVLLSAEIAAEGRLGP